MQPSAPLPVDAAAAFRVSVEALRAAPRGGEPVVEAFRRRHGGSPLGAALTPLLVAHADFFEGRYDAAEAQASEALTALSGLGSPESLVDATMLLGSIALERADYDEAARRYNAAAEGLEGLDDPQRLGRVHNNLGLVAWRTHDTARAEAHMRRALALFGEGAPAAVRANLQSNLGLVLEDAGDVVAAERAYRTAIALALESPDQSVLANALSNLGERLEAQGDRAGAAAHHARALSLRLETGHARGVVGSRVALGRVALAEGRVAEGRVEAEAALTLARTIGLRKHEADALALLAQACEQELDLAGALRFERAAARIREEVQSHLVADRVAALQARFEGRQARELAARAAQENIRLQAAMAEVAAASEARGRFLAVMSHEMRTPLTSILGAAELLDLQPLDAGQRRLVRVITTSASTLLSTIGDVLDFSMIDAGKLELAREPFDPAQVVQQVQDIVETARRAKGLSLSVQGDGALPGRLLGDAARVRQVLVNLVFNAIKFTDAGGVSLRLSHDREGLRVEVEDTGIGVTAAARDRLFEPFFQADVTPARRHGGSGLGLAIVQRIVRDMGGQLSFSSEEGRGTTFRLLLPLPAQALPAPPVAPVARQRPRVLFADDDPMIREVMVDLLSAAGAEPTVVASGEAAVAEVARTPYDLVLLDLHMPGMDGVAALSALQSLPACPPVIAVSGAVDPSVVPQLLAAGFADAVSKPLSLARLRALLSERP